MKTIFALVFSVLFLLAGCKKDSGGSSSTPQPPDNNNGGGDEEPTDLPSYEFNFDKETPGGIMLETNQLNHPPLEDIDLWYEEVQQCVADWFAVLYPNRNFDFVDAPPFILWNDTSEFCGDAHSAQGIYCANYSTPFVVLDGGWAQFEYVWKHESIHHILFLNEISDQTNLNHLPSQIWDCQFN